MVYGFCSARPHTGQRHAAESPRLPLFMRSGRRPELSPRVGTAGRLLRLSARTYESCWVRFRTRRSTSVSRARLHGVLSSAVPTEKSI